MSSDRACPTTTPGQKRSFCLRCWYHTHGKNCVINFAFFLLAFFCFISVVAFFCHLLGLTTINWLWMPKIVQKRPKNGVQDCNQTAEICQSWPKFGQTFLATFVHFLAISWPRLVNFGHFGLFLATFGPFLSTFGFFFATVWHLWHYDMFDNYDILAILAIFVNSWQKKRPTMTKSGQKWQNLAKKKWSKVIKNT